MTQRDALLSAAIQCLRDRGYARTTSRDILAAAGISSLAAIVYHYGSKEALLNEAFAVMVQDWIYGIEAIAAQQPTNDEVAGLIAVAGRYYETLAANRSILTVFVEALGRAERSDAVREQLASHYETFRATLAHALTTNNDRQHHADMRNLASLIIAVVDGLLIQWLLDPKQALSTDMMRESARALSVPFFNNTEG